MARCCLQGLLGSCTLNCKELLLKLLLCLTEKGTEDSSDFLQSSWSNLAKIKWIDKAFRIHFAPSLSIMICREKKSEHMSKREMWCVLVKLLIQMTEDWNICILSGSIRWPLSGESANQSCLGDIRTANRECGIWGSIKNCANELYSDD